MLDKIADYFTGRVTLYADSENKDKLVSFFTEKKIGASIAPYGENDGVCTQISPFLLKKIAPALDKSGIIVYIINIYGFSKVLSSYRDRWGLAIGAVLFCAILWVSTLFVWRVDVSGSELLSKEQVRAELAEMGVRPGCRISDIDKGNITNRFLSLHPEISWAALNFEGTTVSLSVKETLKDPEEKESAPALLVASCSGVVRSVTVFEGNAAVRPGAVVKKGDVLITGFISGSGLQITDTPLLRFGGARGSIMAEVSGELEEFLPYSEEVSVQRSGDICGYTFSVFGRKITVGVSGGASTPEKNVTVFGEIELPIAYRVHSEVLTETSSVAREREEALEECRARAMERLSEESSGELLRVNVQSRWDETGVTVTIKYLCITDICEARDVGMEK